MCTDETFYYYVSWGFFTYERSTVFFFVNQAPALATQSAAAFRVPSALDDAVCARRCAWLQAAPCAVRAPRALRCAQLVSAHDAALGTRTPRPIDPRHIPTEESFWLCVGAGVETHFFVRTHPVVHVFVRTHFFTIPLWDLFWNLTGVDAASLRALAAAAQLAAGKGASSSSASGKGASSSRRYSAAHSTTGRLLRMSRSCLSRRSWRGSLSLSLSLVRGRESGP